MALPGFFEEMGEFALAMERNAINPMRQWERMKADGRVVDNGDGTVCLRLKPLKEVEDADTGIK